MADDDDKDKRTKAEQAINDAAEKAKKETLADEKKKADKLANNLILEDIDKKQAALDESEKRLEKKTQYLETVIKEAEMSGHSVAGKSAHDSEEDRKNRDAMKLIEGTGLEKRAGFTSS